MRRGAQQQDVCRLGSVRQLQPAPVQGPGRLGIWASLNRARARMARARGYQDRVLRPWPPWSGRWRSGIRSRAVPAASSSSWSATRSPHSSDHSAARSLPSALDGGPPAGPGAFAAAAGSGRPTRWCRMASPRIAFHIRSTAGPPVDSTTICWSSRERTSSAPHISSITLRPTGSARAISFRASCSSGVLRRRSLDTTAVSLGPSAGSGPSSSQIPFRLARIPAPRASCSRQFRIRGLPPEADHRIARCWPGQSRPGCVPGLPRPAPG